MCGFVIVARFQRGAPIDERDVARMRDALAHRGPDDSTLENVDGWVVLGHRRLSIIDVEGAKQPLRGEDGQVVCIFNGEIYNFAELRARLTALGHRFSTAGDGEVIVHGYEQWGDGIVGRLEGMFALALVDRRNRRLVLARDRFGIKPLFYRHDAEGLVAGSELKALLPRGTAPVASITALELGALRMHVPWPLTAFDGIYRLPPGAILACLEGSSPRISRFAPMADVARSAPSSPAAALEVLRTAVARQMVADVPVGAFLSGGIDSTLIVALMRQVSGGDIHTFSVRTVDHDESAVASVTARELGTTHHTILLEQITFDDLSDLPRLYDEPFAETSALGVRALSRFAREHVKVVLSGDGGDEVFGGYDSYRWIRTLAAVALPGRSAAGSIAHRLLASRPWPSSVRRALRAIVLVGDSPATAQRDVTTLAWAASAAARAGSERLSAQIETTSGLELDLVDDARRGMLADRFERLPNAMLAKVDIASMSASLEVRVPMIDDAVVRYADRLPIGELVGLRRGKLLLRRVLQCLPGGRVAWAAKRGFALPLERWMTSPSIKPRLTELFGDHAGTLRALTGVDIATAWRDFGDRHSRFSTGTAAMQLLWFANVALWADRFAITNGRTQRSVAPQIV